MIRRIETSNDIWIGTHIRPDGDALGSLLGLALALEGQGHRVTALSADPAPPTFQFLPGSDRIQSNPPDWSAELGIVVDCDGMARLGPLASDFAALPHLIDIDHHDTDNAFGGERLIESDAAATGEIVYDLLKALGAEIDEHVATCLYTAILTDTGRFCFGNTSSRSLNTAGALVRAGANPHHIARKIYEERSMAAMHLLGLALERLSSDIDSLVVSSHLARGDFEATGAVPSDTEGIIDHLRSIGGPRVALLFVEPDHNGVRVSLRSDGSVDVSAIALSFGGGGHIVAAGCTVSGTTDDVKPRVLDAVRQALADTEPVDA